MAQLEQTVSDYLVANPEIRKAYSMGLINRRALARKIIHDLKAELKESQFEAIIAVLRRIKLPEIGENRASSILSRARLVVKDNIAFVDLAKSKEVLRQIEKIISKISYDENETFKIVLGTSSIKVFIDEKNISLVESSVSKKDIIGVRKKMSEISLIFPKDVESSKGVLAYIATGLSVNDVNVEEFLTCSPELLVYVNEKQVLKAYETIKNLQK